MAGFLSQRLPTECSADLTTRSFLNASTAEDLGLTGSKFTSLHSKRSIGLALAPSVAMVTAGGILVEMVATTTVRKLGFSSCYAVSSQAVCAYLIALVFIWAAVGDTLAHRRNVAQGRQDIEQATNPGPFTMQPKPRMPKVPKRVMIQRMHYERSYGYSNKFERTHT